ncbi:S8 family peptidase [Pontibacter cellulosilyticus]|uniref:S8 family serine peptidase n=1 Tax=Pontibacter cellulosilyticus TaxID=1720253 RepID=A0A923N6C1_9BACT|nr:S8 family peptidase [Pontibacter cellulosilyticus]MBC5992266.1 S8 family serine peptidase [Pontibacter cellulosilyticus]
MKKNYFRAGRFALAMAFVSTAFLTSCEQESMMEDEAFALSDEAQAMRQQGQQMMPNEVLVKFKAGTSASAKAAVLERIGGKVKERILTKTMERFGDREGVTLVHTPMAALEAISKMKGAGEIEYAEPNYIYTHSAATSDPYYTDGSLWGMYGDNTSPANQYGSQAGEAWATGNTGSASVVVGIIDEGIQVDHADLAGNIWTNPYDPVDGVDNDGNGYVDDVNGWDFDGNDNQVYDGGSRGMLDDHGTHVAGTIGAENNGKGVVGVNWNVTMISLKFLGRRGGTTSNAIKAVDYLTDLKNRHGMNIVASNNSWGGGGYSQALYDAIARSQAKDILFVAAAGNGGSDGVGDDNDNVASYPSNYTLDNIIAVASITSSGAKSSFSNYGATTVDIGAPGSGIWSTTAYNMLSSYNGTSMATPHVTGGVALYAASHPGSSAAAIKNAIMSSALPTASLSGRCVTGGRLNVSGF